MKLTAQSPGPQQTGIPQRTVSARPAREMPSATATQFRLQQTADASPYTRQLQQLQALAGQPVSQLAALDEEEALQGAGMEEEEPLQGAGMEEEELLQGAGMEEEEPLQGAGMEEEEPLQGAGMEEEEPLQGAGMEEEEPLQGKFTSAPAPVQREEAPAPNNTGMPDNLKAGVESLSGMDMSGVRVHRNSPEPAKVGAHAYAQGTDIHLASGQEQHLPHEAWHVVQQAQGRVQPTRQAKGVAINDDTGLETEADVMGAKALQQKVSPDSMGG